MAELARIFRQEHPQGYPPSQAGAACLRGAGCADLRLVSEIGETPASDERQFPRIAILCPARIRIGNRQYAGYIHNISAGGAKLRTISAIRRAGLVLLRLPDLPPLRARLAWSDTYNAGVTFEAPLAADRFAQWAQGRSRTACRALPSAATFADLEPLQ